MESAKKIAHDMLDAIDIDSQGVIGAVAKGFISFPVSFYYLGVDFMDTDSRNENFDDKVRITRLIKSRKVTKKAVEKVIGVFIEDFASRINITHVLKNIAGNVAGKTLFSQLTGVNLGAVIASRAVTAFLAGTFVGIVLTVGAEGSRAIYTSRYLRERSPALYYKLKNMGDLDLLYFLVESIVRPFEKACEVDDRDPQEFNKICEYFLGGV